MRRPGVGEGREQGPASDIVAITGCSAFRPELVATHLADQDVAYSKLASERDR